MMKCMAKMHSKSQTCVVTARQSPVFILPRLKVLQALVAAALARIWSSLSMATASTRLRALYSMSTSAQYRCIAQLYIKLLNELVSHGLLVHHAKGTIPHFSKYLNVQYAVPVQWASVQFAWNLWPGRSRSDHRTALSTRRKSVKLKQMNFNRHYCNFAVRSLQMALVTSCFTHISSSASPWPIPFVISAIIINKAFWHIFFDILYRSDFHREYRVPCRYKELQMHIGPALVSKISNR